MSSSIADAGDPRAIKGSPSLAHRRWRWTVRAWLALAAADRALRTGGLPKVRGMVERTAVTPVPSPTDELSTIVCDAIDRAAALYVRSLECIPRSAATACLLRRAGVPAVVVIGCRMLPLSGHAWVEVDGRVVNDRQAVKDIYPELMRFSITGAREA